MQYYVVIAGKQSGPCTEALVRELLANGTITADCLAWYEGLPNWAPLRTVLPQAAPTSPPPLLPQSPSQTQQVRLADHGERLASCVLDALCIFVAFVLGAVYCAIIETLIESKTNINEHLPEALGISTITISFLWLIAHQIRLLCKNGQTIGKKLMGIKIVTFENQTQPKFYDLVVVRSGFFVIVRSGYFILLSIIPLIGTILLIVDAGFIFRKDRRCIHDHIAGTIVIKA